MHWLSSLERNSSGVGESPGVAAPPLSEPLPPVLQLIAGGDVPACEAAPIDEADPVAKAAVSGDPAAIDALWQANRRWVAAILLAHKPRWADVDDLLQEVAVAVVRKIGEVRDPRAVKPWLRTTAMNAAFLAARSGRRRSRDSGLSDKDGVEVAVSDPRSTPAAAGVAASEQGRQIMELATQLPDGYREPLLLKAIHNLSYREIGVILGLPETTVETRIARGRRQLRDLAIAQGLRP